MSNTKPIQFVCPNCHAINRIPCRKLGDNPICGKCGGKLFNGRPIIAEDTTFLRFIEKSDLPVVVDFWAPWCGPCKQFAPVFSEVAAEMMTQACFIKVDTQDNQKTAAQHQVRSIPTLALFSQGREVTRISGALPKSQFQQWLRQNLSMMKNRP